MKLEENKKYWASAFITGNIFFIQTYSGLGMMRIDINYPPHILSPLDEDNIIGSTVLTALSNSRTLTLEESNTFFNPKLIEKDYDKWVEYLMNIYNLSSKKKLFKDMKKCTIEFKNKNILIEPSYHEKLEAWGCKGLSESDNVLLPADSSPAKIGGALRLAFSRCLG